MWVFFFFFFVFPSFPEYNYSFELLYDFDKDWNMPLEFMPSGRPRGNQTRRARNPGFSPHDEHTVLNLVASKAGFVVTNFFIPWRISQQSMWTGICRSVYYVDNLGTPFFLLSGYQVNYSSISYLNILRRECFRNLMRFICTTIIVRTVIWFLEWNTAPRVPFSTHWWYLGNCLAILATILLNQISSNPKKLPWNHPTFFFLG